MIQQKRLFWWLCLGALFGSGCYTLSGVSIDPAIYKSYYVEQFVNTADNAPPALAQEASEALKEKIRTDSRLVLNETNPDIEFKGRIVDYVVTFEAPQPGEQAAINRLRISLALEYIDNKQEKKSWRQNFQFFYDYPSSVDLTSIQQQAHQAILNQIMEDIFNKTFTDW
jgi:hypothetical protein